MAFQEQVVAANISKELNAALDTSIDSKLTLDALYLIAVELRVITQLLKNGLNVSDDVEQLREDTDRDLISPLV